MATKSNFFLEIVVLAGLLAIQVLKVAELGNEQILMITYKRPIDDINFFLTIFVRNCKILRLVMFTIFCQFRPHVDNSYLYWWSSISNIDASKKTCCASRRWVLPWKPSDTQGLEFLGQRQLPVNFAQRKYYWSTNLEVCKFTLLHLTCKWSFINWPGQGFIITYELCIHMNVWSAVTLGLAHIYAKKIHF